VITIVHTSFGAAAQQTACGMSETDGDMVRTFSSDRNLMRGLL